MDITFEEGKLLALYQEFYDKRYNPDDNEVNNIGLIRHEEMQTLGYLMNRLRLASYDFSQLHGTPNSTIIESILRSLDNKKDSIIAFYENYNKSRQEKAESIGYTSELGSVLFYYFKTEDIEIISAARLAFEGIFQTELGRQLMAQMLYYAERSNHSSIETLLIELKTKGLEPSREVVEDIWNVFRKLGIRESVAEEFERKRFRIEE